MLLPQCMADFGGFWCLQHLFCNAIKCDLNPYFQRWYQLIPAEPTWIFQVFTRFCNGYFITISLYIICTEYRMYVCCILLPNYGSYFTISSFLLLLSQLPKICEIFGVLKIWRNSIYWEIIMWNEIQLLFNSFIFKTWLWYLD